jgi:hypothetical protein
VYEKKLEEAVLPIEKKIEDEEVDPLIQFLRTMVNMWSIMSGNA